MGDYDCDLGGDYRIVGPTRVDSDGRRLTSSALAARVDADSGISPVKAPSGPVEAAKGIVRYPPTK